MDGLMALATERAGGKLTFAGAHQAEYHVWLALPGEQTFIIETLPRLQELGFSSLTFTYLPPGTPLEWLQDGWNRRSTLRAVRRPLLAVDNTEAVSDSLNKKKNRRRLEKLQAEGPLSFLELHTPDELDPYYDEIIDFCDFRTGAVHGSCPFREDPRKRAFYRALMAQEGLLHVTVMTLKGKVVAAHIGIRNKSEVMLGIVGHSPFLAEHSPGKLHILQLGLLLHQEGFSSLDLTPGGDAYKDDRATRYDEAYVLSIFLDGKAWARHRVTSGIRSVAKKIAGILHLDNRKLSRWRSFASHPISSLLSLFRSIKDRIWSSTELRLYRARTNPAPNSSDTVRRDSLPDLLKYRPADKSDPPKQHFLSGAMSRVESGDHSYSIVDGNALVSYAWLTPRAGKSFSPAMQRAYKYPPNSAMLEQTWTHPSYRRQGFCSLVLKGILNDAASIGSIGFVYAAVPAGNRAALQLMEEVGLEYQDSIILEVRFGAAKIRVATDSI